ncbi:MAG: hypothetical protein JOY99_12290 [Sphingomonadaceae bacterium]|nr:hypothetical protein [Sphingomonadaceae bacterium]
MSSSAPRPLTAIGEVIVWFVTNPEAEALAGSEIEAQVLCRERELHSACA